MAGTRFCSASFACPVEFSCVSSGRGSTLVLAEVVVQAVPAEGTSGPPRRRGRPKKILGGVSCLAFDPGEEVSRDHCPKAKASRPVGDPRKGRVWLRLLPTQALGRMFLFLWINNWWFLHLKVVRGNFCIITW